MNCNVNKHSFPEVTVRLAYPDRNIYVILITDNLRKIIKWKERSRIIVEQWG